MTVARFVVVHGCFCSFYYWVISRDCVFGVLTFLIIMSMASFLFVSLDLTGPCGFQGDVLFIMDSSVEVSRGDYAKEKDFVESLASFMGLSPGGTRAALLTYGYTATLVANYDSYDTLTPFRNAVQRAPYISGKIMEPFLEIRDAYHKVVL